MPTGEESLIGDLQIWTADGIPITFGTFNNVVTDVITEDYTREYDDAAISFSTINDYSATCAIENTHSFTKLITRLTYGWRAKGPIRKKQVSNAYKFRYGMTLEQICKGARI